MDVFLNLFCRAKFPLGTTLTLCEDDSYCVSVPRSNHGAIIEYGEDPITAAEKAYKRLQDLRGKL
jgi:hypothetical protein